MTNPETVKRKEARMFASSYGLYLHRAIQASMVMDYTISVFNSARAEKARGNPSLEFWHHPANTLTYSALSTSVDEAIVYLFEAQAVWRWSLKNPLRLKVHRDKISHPFMYKHNKPDHDAHLQSDLFRMQSQRRVLVLLHYVPQINERLAKLALGQVVPTATVSEETCRLADAIFWACMAPEAKAVVVQANEPGDYFSRKGLNDTVTKYLGFLEKISS